MVKAIQKSKKPGQTGRSPLGAAKDALNESKAMIAIPRVQEHFRQARRGRNQNVPVRFEPVGRLDRSFLEWVAGDE
ncbi:uncharacterized protein sS8_0591 [Methylocaldum marinum]|uniref:Uncharacterized protein n=1 Tax=Methylocaldum marinum TaxID=1432792 RepID=A0A250KLX8_9GAMM|nr:uncharacterized protein sS8_0591 [Methylocaldum marinum]